MIQGVDTMILLVEDNPDDEALTLRALRKANVGNDVAIVRDGAEALDFLFGTGAHAGRDISLLPQVEREFERLKTFLQMQKPIALAG